MTPEQRAARIHHHMYETCEGIAEHAERIVKLEELVLDMFEEIEAGGFDPMVERRGKRTVYYGEDVGIRERMRDLGIEVTDE